MKHLLITLGLVLTGCSQPETLTPPSPVLAAIKPEYAKLAYDTATKVAVSSMFRRNNLSQYEPFERARRERLLDEI